MRRLVVVAVVVVQLVFVVRAYGAPHKEFGFQMFPESTQWQADIVRVTDDGERVSIREPWAGYEWSELVVDRGLRYPWNRHHADAGRDNQLAFLSEALDWVATNTPDDTETTHLEATVTVWFNLGAPVVTTLRSVDRELP